MEATVLSGFFRLVRLSNQNGEQLGTNMQVGFVWRSNRKNAFV